MRKSLIYVLIIFCAFFTMSGSINASSKKVEYNITDDTVTINVNVSGDEYKFINNGKIVQEGSSSLYKGVLKDDLPHFKIGVFNSGKLKDVYDIYLKDTENLNVSKVSGSFSTIETSNNYEQLMQEKVSDNALNTVASGESVNLTWSELPDEDGSYEVIRDGKVITTTSSLSYTDYDVVPGEQYSYEIIAKKEITEERKSALLQKLKNSGNTLTQEQKKEFFLIRGKLSSTIEVPDLTEESFFAAASLPSGTDDYRFRYKTFIPFVAVEDPKPFNGTYLLGDDRGFSYYSDDYRTKVDIATSFFSGGGDINIEEMDVSTSIRCEIKANPCPYFDILEKDTASTGGISVSFLEEGDRQLRWKVVHDVGIPFGSEYPNINYEHQTSLTRSAFSVNGWNDKAPNHEYYVADRNNGQIDLMHSQEVGTSWDFVYLTPGAPKTYFNETLYK